MIPLLSRQTKQQARLRASTRRQLDGRLPPADPAQPLRHLPLVVKAVEDAWGETLDAAELPRTIALLDELAEARGAATAWAVAEHRLARQVLADHPAQPAAVMDAGSSCGRGVTALATPDDRDSGDLTLASGARGLTVSGSASIGAHARFCDLVLIPAASAQPDHTAVLILLALDQEGVRLVPRAPMQGRPAPPALQLSNATVLWSDTPQPSPLIVRQLDHPLLDLAEATILAAVVARTVRRRHVAGTGERLSLSTQLKLTRRSILRATARPTGRHFPEACREARVMARQLVMLALEARLWGRAGSFRCSESATLLGVGIEAGEVTATRVRGRQPAATASDTPPAAPAAVEDLMASLPRRLRRHRAVGWTAVLHFVLRGSSPSEWTVAVANGSCQVTPGLTGDADCLVRMRASTFVRISSGTLNPQVAFMTGQVKVSNIAQMSRFIKVFGVEPGAGSAGGKK